jgi:hypothetical protein
LIVPERGHWWRLPHPEAIILIVVPTAALAILGLLGRLGSGAFGREFWVSLIYMRFFGWQGFHVLFFLGLSYLAVGAVAYAVHRLRIRRREPGEPSPAARRFAKRFQMARSFIGLVAAYAYAIAINIVVVNALCSPSPQRVGWANDLLMQADRAVFGTYVPFEMHGCQLYAELSSALMFSYVQLGLVLSLVLMALFIFRTDHFRQYVLMFVAITFLCMVGWATLPATTPSEGYRTDKLHLQPSLDAGDTIAAHRVHVDNRVADFLNRIEPYESNPAEGRYFITSFPSLHVAWGILIVWFGVQLYRGAVILLLPWGICNCVGAVYSLQHYAVDAVGGMIAAVAVLYLMRRLAAMEKRRGVPTPRGYAICKFIQRDLLLFTRLLRLHAKRKLAGAKA